MQKNYRYWAGFTGVI